MRTRQKTKTLLFYSTILIISLIFSSIFNQSFASAISIHGHSQGSTITKDYFIYTDHRNDNATSILRCKRKGSKTSGCKTIVKTKDLDHANALDHVWGSNYFAVYDGYCNPHSNSSCVEGCYTLNGKSVSKSKCKQRANNKYKNKGSSTSQGYAQYKVGKTTYFLKGFSGPNKIQVYKNGKLIKTITGLKGGELEDVMVDGDTGKIYYTVSGWGSVNLYGVGKKYTLPTSSGSDSSSPKKYSGKHVSPVSSRKNKNKDSTETSESHYDGTVDTVFFGEVKDDGNGCSIFNVLNFIIEILTYGIGITGVIGISFFGIMYLTAGGDAAKTTKAKTRIYEIVIGIVAYAVLWTLLNFLLPGGNLNPSEQCSKSDTSTSSSQFIV
ncbi:hypothetical protein IKF28_03640 [Candidatus Saccharibacteria bacterium]|nr:hypothetical protein [Candidatus Saccharibacteria bacterium]